MEEKMMLASEASDEASRQSPKASEASREVEPPLRWEAFCDPAYYHMWAVRPVGETRFGYVYHVLNVAEADDITARLNRLESEVAMWRDRAETAGWQEWN